MYAVRPQFIVVWRGVRFGIFFHRLSVAYAVAQWLSCRIYGGGNYMPLGKAATVAAVVGANHAVRHQLELYRFGSIHIKKLLPLHADALTVGAYLKYAPPEKYPCGIL